ncbi:MULTISPECIES: M23 family metallopeptidase [Microbacterium]|uniref:Peptidase family M23 n=1 Tax=Microbacterium saccharophilum TaxID=1213358 RepID=A0A7Z7CX92_9MICO|nr:MULTISPECIES: M23 family metallopeptidase [Microbacterium]SFI17650.1 Peptidase family M23 [Microbacterium saccharophilum]
MTRAEWRRLMAEMDGAAGVETAPGADRAEGSSISLAETVLAEVLVESLQAEVAGAEVAVAAAAHSALAPAAPARRRVRAEQAPSDAPADADTGNPAGAAFTAASEQTGEQDDCLVDEFERAARLFSFTAEVPVQRAASSAAEADAQPVSAASVAPAAASRRSTFKRVAAASFSLGVMGVVGLLAVGITTPASAVAAVSDGSADLTVASHVTEVAQDEIQAYVAASDTQSDALNRPEAYDVASMADIAAASGVTEFAGTWVSDPTAPIQWPFPVGVPISAAYGSGSYLAQFSSPHRGVDLTPGAGAEVHVIANGTVRIATEGGGDYGVTVVVDHVVDGQPVSTRYAHMQYNSLKVKTGDRVSTGDVLGLVGSTGKATGAHLHFEVLLGTTRTDPIAWMYEHTKG